jgi:hypothetical protein
MGLQLFLEQDGHIELQPAELDACLHAAFETETNTLRVLVPIELFPGTAGLRVDPVRQLRGKLREQRVDAGERCAGCRGR